MGKLSKITKKELKDEENLDQCECGNWSHQDYMHYDDSGATTCPLCQVSFMEDTITKLLKLSREIADPELSKEDVDGMVKVLFKEVYGFSDDDDLDEMDFLNLN